MKRILTLVAATLLTAACGNQENYSTAKSVESTQNAEKISSFVLQGTIEAVETKSAAAPALGIWTEVTIAYNVPCTQKLESFAYTIRDTKDGNTEILASAISTSSESLAQFACQAFGVETKMVTLPGIVAAESVTLLNLDGPAVELMKVDGGFSTEANLEIVDVAPLCGSPNKCLLNGTMITVRAHMACLDQLGPVTYLARQKAENGVLGKIELAVSGVVLSDRRSLVAYCKKENTKDVVITLANIVGALHGVNVVVVK